MSNICPQPLLPANPKESDFTYFLRQFDNYLTIVEAKEKQKLPLLLNAIGRDGLNIYDGLKEPKQSYTDAVTRLKEYYVGSSNILIKRKLFFNARQNTGESCEAFACRLRKLASECSFTDSSELLRDIFVIGVSNDRLGERFLSEDPTKLTFDAAVTKSCAYERALADRSSINHEKPELANAVGGSHIKKSNQSWGGPAFSRTGSMGKHSNSYNTGKNDKVSKGCLRCGFTQHTGKNGVCPAINSTCRYCNKIGHWAHVCMSKSKQTVKQVNTSEDVNEDNKFDIFTVTEVANHAETANACVPVYEVVIGTRVLQCVADTGASVNIVPVSCLPETHWIPVNSVVKSYGGVAIPVVGSQTFQVKFRDRVVNADFIGVDVNNEKPLLSYDLCVSLGIFSDEVRKVDCDPAIFDGLGCVQGVQFHLKLKDDAHPRFFPTRRVPPAILQRVETELENMSKQGVIVEDTDSEWSSPMVPVLKRDGSVRICVDFRHINKSIKREHFQIPSLEDILTQLQGATVFSCLDARSGYLQIPVAETSQKFLVFSTPFGNFRFTRMPFGISSAPEIFQKCMSHLLSGLKGVVCYLDDVLVSGKTQSEHDNNLLAVIQRLKQCNLKLNKEKCVFSQPTVTFLGHVLSAQGIHPDPEKQKALMDIPQPTTVKEVRSFLGLAGYVGQRFVPHFSTLTSPIWQTIKGEKLLWSNAASSAFDKLKLELSKSLNLTFFDNNSDTILKVDASGVGIGGVLIQNDRPVLFASRKLSPVEQRYAHIEKEFLSIVFCCYRFKSFLVGKSFEINTDNAPLIAFFDKPLDRVPLRIQRWLLSLQCFSFNTKHISGKDNNIADTLSRCPASDIEPCEAERAHDIVNLVRQTCPLRLEDIQLAISNDAEASNLIAAIQSEWTWVNRSIKCYTHLRTSLTLADNLLFFDDRLFIPRSLRGRIIADAHEGHLGQSKMKEILRSHFFWPKMGHDIEEYVRQCQSCIRFSGENRHAPLQSTVEQVNSPWQRVAIDITGPSERLKGATYLSVIDYYSRFPFLHRLHSTSSHEIIEALTHLFSLFGTPFELVSDNGTNFVSQEFETFLASQGIKHFRSSNYYPQSNGVVERLHATVKHRLDKLLFEGMPLDKAVPLCLRELRSSPHSSTGETPFFRMFGREMNTRYMHLDNKQVITQKVSNKQKYIRKDNNMHARVLNFSPGQKVLVRFKNKNTEPQRATIITQKGYGSWEVLMDRGYKRVINQRYLREVKTEIESGDLPGWDTEGEEPPLHRYNLRPRLNRPNYKE